MVAKLITIIIVIVLSSSSSRLSQLQQIIIRFASPRLSQRPCTMPLTKLGNVQRRGGEEIWKKLGRNSKRKYLKISGKNFLRCGGEIFLERKQKVPGEETAGSVSHTHSTIYLFNYLFEINFAQLCCISNLSSLK